MKYIACLGLILVLMGCATSSYPTSNLETSVGKWTYQDALDRYGKPDSREVLKDGTIVAKWVTKQPGIYAIEEYDSKTSQYVPSKPTSFKETLTIAFNRHKVVKSWRTETDDPQVIPQVHSSE